MHSITRNAPRLSRNQRQFNVAVDVVIGEGQTEIARGICDQSPRHLRQQRLASFVVVDVALGAADAVTQGLLRDSEVFSDASKVMHPQILAVLLILSIALLFAVCQHFY